LVQAFLSAKSTLDGNTSTIEQKLESENGVFNQYSLTIDNNGAVSGFGLVSDIIDGKVTSSFVVNADTFAIGSEGNYPFVVYTEPTTIDGVTYAAGVYIKDASIQTLSANKIKLDNTYLDTDVNGNLILSTGGVDSDIIKDGSILESKVVDGAITNAKISGTLQSSGYASSGYPLWEIDKKGGASFSSIEIRADDGTVLMSAGQKMDYAALDNPPTLGTLAAFNEVTYSALENDLKGLIDGKIESWFSASDPAVNWTNNETKDRHLGDMWWKTDVKKLYRFVYDENGYSWSQLTDQTAIDAYDNAATAQDTADGKRRVFVSTPTVPYDVGDLWDRGSETGIWRCKTAKDSNGSYSLSDWQVVADKTGDNTAAAIVDQGSLATKSSVEYADLESGLAGLIDGKVESWFSATDPATWATEDNAKHLGDMWWDTDDNKLYRYAFEDSNYVWLELTDQKAIDAYDLASSAQSAADGKVQAFTSTPVAPYGVGDIWKIGTSIYVATVARTGIDGDDYQNSDWVLTADKTSDNTAASIVDQGDLATEDKVNYSLLDSGLAGLIDGKIETWFDIAANDPAAAWTDNDTKSKHLGDMWWKTDTKKLFRYVYSSSTYKWEELTDQTAVDAYQTASAAQDTADGKRRVFVSTPTVPYDVGDLWDRGDDLGLWRATLDKNELGNYDIGDWQRVADATVENTAGSGVNILNPRYVAFVESSLPPYVISRGVAALTNDAYFGTQALKVTSTGNDCFVYLGSSSTDYNFAITPNKKWIFSAYVKSNTANAQIQLYIRTGNSGSFYGKNLTASATAGTWKRISDVFNLTYDDSTRAIIRVDNDISGVEIVFDGFMLEEQIGNNTAPSAFVAPPNFLEFYSGDLDATKGANLGTGVGDGNITGEINETNFTTYIKYLNASVITAGELRADIIKLDGITLDTDANNRLVIKGQGVGTDQIADEAIDTDQVKGGAITNAKIRGAIESDVNAADGNPLWSIDKDGGAEFRQIVIKDDFGNVLMQSGGLGSGSVKSFKYIESFDYANTTLFLEQWQSYAGTGEYSLLDNQLNIDGRVLNIGNNNGNDQRWLIGKTSYVYAPDKLYRIKVRVRQLAGSGRAYIGVAGRNETDTAFVNVDGLDTYGSQHYFAASDVDISTAWTEFTGYFSTKGSGFGYHPDIYDAGELHEDAKFFRPLILVNYSGLAGITQIDYFRIEEITSLTDLNIYNSEAAVGGLGSVQFLKNKVTAGTDNNGEIQITAGNYYHPNGTKAEIVASEINTNFEGSVVQDKFYIFYSDSSIKARFSSLSWLAVHTTQFFIAVYDDHYGKWYVVDNSGGRAQFTPADTDAIVAYGSKTTVGTDAVNNTGIDKITSLLNTNINMPEDNATVGATFGVDINGSIDATNFATYIKYLNADVITAGSLNANRIKIDDVTLDTDGSGNLIIKGGGVDTAQLKVESVNVVKTTVGSYTARQVTKTYYPSKVTTNFYRVLKTTISSYLGKDILIQAFIESGVGNLSKGYDYLELAVFVKSNTTLVAIGGLSVGSYTYDSGLSVTTSTQQGLGAFNFVYNNPSWAGQDVDIILAANIPDAFSTTEFIGYISNPSLIAQEIKR